MKKTFRKLMREQVQEKTDMYANILDQQPPSAGWISTIRNALGISMRALAKKMGCTQANIAALEDRERKGTITLESLNQVAAALNCRLVYGLVPIKPINEILEDQARLVARKRMRIVNQTMALEDQALTKSQLRSQENNLAQQILEGPTNKLWDIE